MVVADRSRIDPVIESWAPMVGFVQGIRGSQDVVYKFSHLNASRSIRPQA